MKTSEHTLITALFERLHDADQDDDEQMALLIGLMDELATRDLPIPEIVAFMLNPCEGSTTIWLLEQDHLATWDACLALVTRDAQRIPHEPVVTALRDNYDAKAAAECEDTDDDDVLGRLIELAGYLGPHAAGDVMLPLLMDERILVRRRAIEALGMLGTATPIVAMLDDISAQIRIVAMQQLGLLHHFSLDQAQRMAVDPHPRVRAAALVWVARQSSSSSRT